VPVDPGPTPWSLPDRHDLAELAEHGGGDLVAIGADLEPATLVAAYRHGLFPMPTDDGLVGWWSPERRGVQPLDGLRVSRSLRQSVGRFATRVDTAFAEVVEACADPDRPQGWISDDVRDAYVRLHRMGWAHSVETWDGDRLVGGLYGVAIDGLFAGESMFHRERDASKVALVALVELLREDGLEGRLLDVQWSTPHLASLGVVEVDRDDYLDRLAVARGLPLPPAFA
jgi:leucyl/phenylalanyl-tRNA--protein transferase